MRLNATRNAQKSIENVELYAGASEHEINSLCECFETGNQSALHVIKKPKHLQRLKYKSIKLYTRWKL